MFGAKDNYVSCEKLATDEFTVRGNLEKEGSSFYRRIGIHSSEPQSFGPQSSYLRFSTHFSYASQL